VRGTGTGERCGVGERHDGAGTRAEQVLRVPVRRRNDGAACGNAEGERARRDLLAVPVRGHEDVGRGEQVGDRIDAEKAIVELHMVLEAEVEVLDAGPEARGEEVAPFTA
jgi:hypothetical protein